MTDPGFFSPHLRVAAAAHTPVPKRHLHAVPVVEQEVVCPHHVRVGVAAHCAVQVVEDRVFVSVQVVVLEPLARTAKERPEGHLGAREALRRVTEMSRKACSKLQLWVSLDPKIVCITDAQCVF